MMFALAGLMVVIGLVGLVPSFLRFVRGRNATLRAEMAAAAADVERIHAYLDASEEETDDVAPPPVVEDPVAIAVAAPLAEEDPPAVDDSATADEPPQAEEPVDEPETPADEDDIMALFRQTKVKSGFGEVLQDSFEDISIAELLAEARSLRELIAPLVPPTRRS